MILVQNFSSPGWFSFSSTFISCHHLLTAVNVIWQLIWKKFNWNFYVHTKVYIYAKFSLSMLILNLINFYQLSAAVDSLWQLIWKKVDWNFHGHIKVSMSAEFHLFSLIFIFISCQQLFSAVDSCWQQMIADMTKIY